MTRWDAVEVGDKVLLQHNAGFYLINTVSKVTSKSFFIKRSLSDFGEGMRLSKMFHTPSVHLITVIGIIKPTCLETANAFCVEQKKKLDELSKKSYAECLQFITGGLDEQNRNENFTD